MSWLERIKPSQMGTQAAGKKSVPEGVWAKCTDCGGLLYEAELQRTMRVCPKCSSHQKIGVRERLDLFLDAKPRKELVTDIFPEDPLKFRDSKKYRDRISQAQKKTGEKRGIVVIQGELKGIPVVTCAMNFSFLGGSMGSVVGEAISRAANLAAGEHMPLIIFVASGGARMQEGLFSLLQMAKTSAALTRLAERGVPYIPVLTNPTTGGVSASFAMLGDVIVAEPGSLIGFAGPRVIKETVKQELPEGFQRPDFLLEHGAIDMIVDRRELRDKLHNLLALLTRRQPQVEAAAT